MTTRARTLLLSLATMATLLAACGTSGAPAVATPPASESVAPSATPTVAPSVTPSIAPSVEASESPAETPAAEREVAGTITVAEGMAFSGPGGSIQEAIDAGPIGDMPSLVNGVIFRDLDGRIYLATSLSDASAPTFDGPMLEVLNMDDEGSFDMANAELLNLEEANGIVFRQQAQVLGYLEIA